MWNPKQSSSINKSLDHLSSKFNELEKICQTTVQKGLAESKNILSQQTTLSSEIYSSLIKEQTRLENNQRALISIRKSYNDELNNLRLTLFGESIESTSTPDKSFAELKTLIEETVLDTRDKVLEMPELNYFDNSIKERVQNYFEETFQRLDSTFLQFNNVKELNAAPINFKKIEMIANTNLLSLTGIDNVISQAKRRIIRALEAGSTCSSSFAKEVHTSEGLLNQIREKIFDIKQGASLQKSCDVVEKLVNQAINSNSKKTELFESANKELENICSKFNQTVKELTKHSEIIKNNHQTLESTINKEKKKARQSTEPDEQISKGEELKRYNSATYWNPGQASSPNLTRSPLFSEVPDFMDTLCQKILHLRTTTGNFISSCEKMGALIINTSSEGNYAVKVFENEKKLVENYIISLAEFVMQQKNRSQESALTKASSPQAFRSTGGFDLSPDHNKDSLFRSVDSVKSASKLEKLKALESSSHINKVTFSSKGFEDEYAERGRTSHGLRDKTKTAGLSAEPYESHDSHRYDSRAISLKVSPLRSPGHKLEKDTEDTARRTEKEKNRALLSNLLQKVKDLSEQNEKLKKEVPRIAKENKKLELKADKRKKTVKQLFELVTEKEKELTYYKTNYTTLLTKTKNVSGVDVEQIEQIVDKKGEVMMEKYRQLEAKMGAKETEIQKLKEIVSAGATPGSKGYRGKMSPRFGEEEEDEGRKLVAQTKELDKKRESIEEALQNINDTSPSQVKELNSLLTSLKKEKEQNLIRIRGSTHCDPKISDLRNVDLKAATGEEKSNIERLEAENKALEARCHELLNDIEQVQAHKQKIEKSYQEEVKLLNDKVRELNEYIQSLEVKKNEKLREALSPDKWRANLDFKDAVSPQKSDEGQPNENKKLKNQIKGLVSKVESLLDHFGITKEEYSMMDSDEKIEIISARVKKEEKAIARKEDGEKLTTELNELKQLVNSRDSQIKKLESEIANQKTVIVKFGDLEKNNQLLQEEIASQQEKVAKANSQKQKAEEQVEGLRSQLKAKEEEITAALSQNKGNETELKESSGQYEDQLRALKQQLTNKENTIRDLERKSEQNDNSIVDLEKKFNEKEKELSRLKQELVSEKERLQKEVDAASSRTLEQANAQATQDIEAYKVEVNGLNNKLAGLEAQIASVNKEKQEVQNSLEAAVKEKEALQGQIKDLKEKNNSLEQVKKALEIQVSTLEVKVAAGANDQQDVAEKLSKLQEAIDSLRNEKIKAEEELGKATTQFELEKKTLQEKLEKIIGEKEAELKDRKEDLQKVEKANSELNNVNNELNRRVGELTKSNEELKVEKEAALNETINLNEQSSQAKEAIKNQISEYEKAIQKEKDQLKQAQDELTQFKIQKESIQKGLEVAEGKINELEKKLEEKEKDLQKISEENNNVKKELEKRETEAAVQQQEFSRKRAELEQTLAKGSGDVVAKQEEIEKLKEQISIVEGQVEEEKKKVQELISTNEKKLLEAHREFYEKNKQITNQNEALVRDNQLLKAEGGKLSKEYQILLDKEAELQSELNAFVEKHEEMQAGLTKSLEAEKQLTKTLQDETRAESQRLHRKVEKLQRELEKSRENNETLKGNYEKLVEEHKQKQEHIHALGQEIDQLSGSLKAKVSELEVSKNSGSKEAQSIRNEYDYQLQHLNIENESLKRTKEELEEEIKSLREDLRIERGHIEKMNGEKDALEEKGDQLADETAGLKEKLAEVEGELEKVKTQSNSKIEKLVQEEKALKEENKRLEGENEELKMTTLSMREEIVNLGSKGEDDKKTGKIAMVYREELMNLVKNKPFSEIGMVKLENEEEIRQTIKAIKDAVENQEKKKEELNKLVKTMRSDASDKIKRVSEDIKDVIEILPTEYVPDDEEGIEEQVQSSIWMNAIKEYIIETNGMRREYKDLQQEVQETQTEARNLQEKLEHDEKLRRDLEKHKEALESENKQLKVEVSQSPTKNIGSDNFLRPQSPHKEAFSFRRKSDARDPSFSVPDEIDEGKVRSFLEDSIKEKSDHKRDERLFSQEQEQIKTLFEQIRQLQDENDKLETENRQVKAKYEMLGFENEDLKGELADKEGEIKKLEEQLFVIKEEFSKIQMEKDRKGDNPIAHEKQHIRTMFTKFILSALQGNKDAEDLLKLLLSLLDINEKDKTNMMNEFKSKNTKKGVFAKLF